MQRLAQFILVTVTTSLGANFAQAQMVPCGARDDIIARLGEKYGETRRGSGLSGADTVIEIYASETTGSWTILRTDVRGRSCVMAVGEGWQDDSLDVTPKGDPT